MMNVNLSRLIARLTLVLVLTPFAIHADTGDDSDSPEAMGSRYVRPTAPTIGINPGFAGGVYAPGAGVQYLTSPVPIPPGVYDKPQQLYVLPVVVAPSDYGQWLPDHTAPGLNLNGTPFVGAPNPWDDPYAVLYKRVENNLSVHLQTARLMYENMMRNPFNGEPRGTFALARWDAQAGLARKVISTNQYVDPLVIKLQNYTRSDIFALQASDPQATPHWVAEILDKIGCQRMSCPFVLSIVVVGNPFALSHGAKWNYGYNNGGGTAFFNYTTVRNSWNTSPTASHNFLSTLVHELGHAFGSPHSQDYCGLVPDCANQPRFDQDLSDSIMSYNTNNWILGCPRSKRRDPTHCLLPVQRDIVGLPGKLEREDKRLFDTNKLVFPEFEYTPTLDHTNPNDPVYKHYAGGDWDVTASARLKIDSPHTGGIGPTILIGGHSETFVEKWETSGARTWVSTNGAPYTWAQLNIYLPATVTLKRLRVYGGFQGDKDRPAGLQLFVAGDPSPIAADYNLFGPNHDLTTNRSGSHFILQVQRGASGVARLRGLRLFAKPAGDTQTIELYSPAEPVATTGFGSTFGGSVDNIVGSDQQIAAVTGMFQPTMSWHSSKRTPGSWVSVDIKLPAETMLRGFAVHTSHTNGVHRATQIQIERECVCRFPYSGLAGSCGSQSIAHCEAAGGVGERVYEFVYRESNAELDDFVAFPDTTARRWRIALKTQNGLPGSDSWMVVRGLRPFTGSASGYQELFLPRALY